MYWRDDLNDVEPQCPTCGGVSVGIKFTFAADGSLIGANWCKRCKSYFIAVLPIGDIIENIRESERRGIMTAYDCLTDSETKPLTEEEVDGFIEGWDNGAIWEELSE